MKLDNKINESELNQEAGSKDLKLWYDWKANPTNNTLKPLLKSVSPIIETHVNKLYGNIPRSAIQAQMTKLTVEALPNYDPSKSKLSTYLYNTAGMKLHRYVYTHQNMGAIPEPRIIQIGRLQKVRSSLEGDLGRPPTYEELSDEMRVPVRQLELLDKELRQDLIQDHTYTNVFGNNSSDIDDSVLLLYSELQGNEKEIVGHIYGLDGRKIMSNTEIANKLGISVSAITNIKNKIADRLLKSRALMGY